MVAVHLPRYKQAFKLFGTLVESFVKVTLLLLQLVRESGRKRTLGKTYSFCEDL